MPIVDPLVSIIILNWNRKYYLNRYLSSLLDQNYLYYEIYLLIAFLAVAYLHSIVSCDYQFYVEIS
jgi:hypothetical protein